MDKATKDKATKDKAEAMAFLLKHKEMVADYTEELAVVLKRRGKQHDDSKIEEPELSHFANYFKNLSKLTFGSPEYLKNKEQLKPCLDHHYANNRHHPEHFKDGIKDMNLIDLIEMLIDWYCASKLQNNGNIRTSIDKNKETYKISDDLAAILENTIELLDR